MLDLALVFWLAVSPAALSPAQTPFDPVAELASNPCAVAWRIAAQSPCLRPEDCGAFDDWTKAFGLPHVEPLAPTVARQGVIRVVRPRALQPRLQQLKSPLCLAQTRAARENLRGDAGRAPGQRLATDSAAAAGER